VREVNAVHGRIRGVVRGDASGQGSTSTRIRIQKGVAGLSDRYEKKSTVMAWGTLEELNGGRLSSRERKVGAGKKDQKE